ncbi:uncharacterized protein LOC123318360 [Coccinella septempunctata]|uniref:uncharacterized protein LOC123318360 n=1 Tax=Coccinella septempunctata TaxID=41139 RepID=UPI001D082686|nr:uncharacterized protein LOC123318360 [Coccinella septempunctata]
MQISTTKTKSLVISKEPKRCKLVVADQPIEQVMTFSYLGVQISSNQDRTYEVREQASKACRMAGALRDVIFNNKYMSKQSKTRIYKTCVRPIMTYAIETRADNKRTKSILRTTEMKILRTISGYTLRDRKRNTAILEECQVQDIVKWGRARRRYWNNHNSRMNAERIAKIARDGIPNTRRPIGRPPKRWKDSWVSTSIED